MTLLVVSHTASGQYQARHYYGAKFEPQDGILHAGGQIYSYDHNTPQDQAFEYYADTMGPNRYPVVFMGYCGLGTTSYFTTLRNLLVDIRDNEGKWVIPQLGMAIPSSGQPTQAQIDTFVYSIKTYLDWPCFLRIGYEFNGFWYNPVFNPTDFKASWIAITNALRAADVEAATVWGPYAGSLGSPYGTWSYVYSFYPGDEYVDWFGADVFSAGDLTCQLLNDVIANAHAHGKPLMLGEATPRFVGADDAADWNTWFVPFFDIFKNNPGVKGHAYINWDWGSTAEWPTWGDARLQSPYGDPTVRANYLSEMDDDIWVHAVAGRPTWTGAVCGDWGYATADFNQDCYVEWADFGIFAGQWQQCIDPEESTCQQPWNQQ